MSGRTVTLTEREVSAFRSALALYEVEYAEQADPPTPERAQDLRALERINDKLVAAQHRGNPVHRVLYGLGEVKPGGVVRWITSQGCEDRERGEETLERMRRDFPDVYRGVVLVTMERWATETPWRVAS